MTHKIDAEGILYIVFDRQGEKVNLLGKTVLEELARVLEEASRRDDVRAILFASAKPKMFVAGMDVEEISSVNDAYRAAEGARFGQAIFEQVAQIGRPSACAIGGTCLGGGTELALACTFRVAADEPSLRIGLPEVKIGIVPGFGGTQRLPRLVGLPASLDMILTGRGLTAKQAKRIGLVDRIVPASYLEREALGLLRRAAADGIDAVVRSLKRPRPLAARLAGRIGPLRRYVLNQARKKTESKVNPLEYPAPFRAIHAVEAAFLHEMPQGLDYEARVVGELVPTPTSKNLIWLFKSHASLKGDNAGIQAVPRRVRRCSVIGAGVMGGGIAQLVANREVPVRLKDVRYDAILTALRTARSVYDHKLKRRRMTEREVAQKMAFIAPTLDDSGLRQVDLVIEAVVESLEIKRQVLAQAEHHLDDRAVFATNTSSLPIREIAAHAVYPERVVGLHFFNPVHRMPLVEVIKGQRSSPEALATVRSFALALGKVPVVVRDEPGFLVNRILMLYLNEALGLLREGLKIETIDAAMSGFGMPMGPLALLDQVGLDTAGHVADVLKAAFGARLGGDDTLLRAMVASGRLGQKNGKGFYRYRDGKRTTPDAEVYGLLECEPGTEIPPETLQERMVFAMINEAIVCLQDGVVREPRDVDLAMVMGTGFPAFRGGLLRHADSVGIPIVADRLSRLAEAHGERYRPAGSLQQMVREQRRFYA
ncbi:MAG: fatty acid oxidation complex subunit alpha FadJ [bacterium]|nr:fatty acid oxidation complex subunit alpha FadJ [bacterium]